VAWRGMMVNTVKIQRPRDSLGRFLPNVEREFRALYSAREVFLPLHSRAQRWAIAVAHRRAGKTVACVNELIAHAAGCPHKDGRFAYIAPQLNQAKDIAWHYLLEYTDMMEPGRRVNASELWVELPNNKARIRLYGADNPDRLRGLRLDGVVMDEYGDMTPGMWTRVIRPLLTDREGWAIFIGTPKGKNGFWKLWQQAAKKPDWLRLSLKASETGLIDEKELADVRQTLSEDEYEQEYECSFEAAVRGSYWGREIAAIEKAGQVTEVKWDPSLYVHTAWDLGMADSTVIWLFQRVGPVETRVIDVIKGEGVGLEWYVRELEAARQRLQNARPHRGILQWGDHILPHDAEVRELGTGVSRLDTLWGLGIRGKICPQLPVADGIQAVRALLPNCWFDRERCAKGIEALRMYRREYDPKREELRANPLHDWTSHYADAFRYFAVGYRPPPMYATRMPKRGPKWWV